MSNDPHSQHTTQPDQPSRPVTRTSPEFPHDLPAILPAELLDAPRWIVWRFELDADGDAWTKKPINPRTGKSGAKSTDPRTWGTFAQAAARYDAGGFDGLMFALGDGIVGVDLDHCIDTATGELGSVTSKYQALSASTIVEVFATYTEVSPSGDGVHLWMRGELPVGGRKSHNVEMYATARFLSVTGARITGDELAERSDVLAAFHREVFFDEAATHQQPAPRVAPGAGSVLTDEAIIEKAHNAKNSSKFLALWNGDRSGYRSGSEADLALVSILAFYTSDEDQLDRLFRQSGLMREKWERDDYRRRTIDKVLGNPARLMWTPASERDGTTGQRRRGEPAATVTTTGPLPALRKHYQFTEFGNADRLLDAHGADIRYSEALGFTVWDGRRWKIDDELTVRTWAHDVVRDLFGEAAEVARQAQKLASEGDDAGAKSTARYAESLSEWARKSSTDHMMSAVVHLVQPHTRADASEFDTHPMLFNCANGTIDLTTGKLREHRREDYLTQCSPVEYDPNAQAPTFLRFLGEIMLERDELVDYLHRAFGYSITGDVSEQVWHLLVGEGSNGKTTLIEALEYCMGDYAATMEPESITITGARRDAAAPSPDMAKLQGVRFTKITETEEGARIAPARIKKLSGGDKLSARYLHKNIFEFYPTHKLWLYTNHRPEARETTHAFWRRVRYVPFELNLREHPERKDKSLPDKLRAEAPGILAWLVSGALRWRSEGLDAPEAMTEAAESYRADMDVLAAFVRDCCVVAPQHEVKASRLYKAYQEWCEDNGEFAWKQRRFGQALSEKGYGTRKSHGDILRTGLMLRDPNDPGDNWWKDDDGGNSGDNGGRSYGQVGHSGDNHPPASAQATTGSAESGDNGGLNSGVGPRAYTHRADTLKIDPPLSPAPPRRISSGVLAPQLSPESSPEGFNCPPGWEGPGYSLTPPNPDEPCSHGGRHMWAIARGGNGYACKKCRPGLVNRPGR